MTAGHETVPIYPRLLDCFPNLKSFPGCKVPLTETPAYFKTTYMRRTTPSPVAPVRTSVNRTDNGDEESDGGNDEAIALPSTCMGSSAGTRQDELPTIPPPSQYWKLKKLDHSANVMDYWIKSCQQWDIQGIESDIFVVMGQLELYETPGGQ